MRPTKVTLVVTQRERTSLTERSLESVLAERAAPFRLIYVDGGAPHAVRAYLERRALEADFMLIQRPQPLWPNAARNLALAHVETEYVVFIDNDVEVEPGWLAKLIACADETGAALVGPLYLWSDGIAAARIHMAGGILTDVETPAGRALHERHDRINAPVSERTKLTRGECDFLEYHCMLARADFLRRVGGLSEDVVCVHEHIDIALEAKAAGLPVVFEPAAAITQHSFAPYLLSDLDFHRWRWNRAAAERSLSAFCRKWNLVDDGEAMRGIRGFVDGLTSGIDPLMPSLQPSPPATAIAAGDVRQNLYGLLTQAAAMGYARADLELFSKAYNAAMTLFAGGFRPCARPFIAHCVGTASALVAFGFAPRVVVAGLLHAAYSHAPLGPRPHAALTELEGQLRATFGDRIARAIGAYARFQLDVDAWRDAHPIEMLSLDDAETIAVAIANEIDQCASGEVAFTAKTALDAPEWNAYFRALSIALGVPAFAETLFELARAGAPPAFDMRRPHSQSFHLVKGGIAPMAHGAFRAWDANAGSPRTRTDGLTGHPLKYDRCET